MEIATANYKTFRIIDMRVHQQLLRRQIDRLAKLHYIQLSIPAPRNPLIRLRLHVGDFL